MNRKPHDLEYRRLILTVRAATGLPLAWSAVTGILAGFLVGSLSVVLGSTNAMAIGAVAGSSAAFVSWILGLRWWLSVWYGQQEQREQAPIEWMKRDPQNPNVIKRATITKANQRQLSEVARLVYYGKAITTDTLNRIFNGSRTRLVAFRDEMVDCKFLEWKNPDDRKSGLIVTSLGYMFLVDYLPPTLKAEAIKNARNIGHTQETHRGDDGE